MTPADLAPRLSVGLRDDPEFRGYVLALLAVPPGEPARAVVAIASPGKTGKRGNRDFAIADLVPAASGKGRSR